MDKKAFTLIELLAVIVILGILALIVTPILINVVKDSNEKSYKLSADGYISAVNDYILSNQLDGKKVENGKYNIKNLDVKISGKAPSKGSVEIYDEKINNAQLCYDTYLLKYDGREVTLTEKGCEKEATVNLAIGEKKYDNVTKDDIETEFNISDDISDMTNIVCNNGVTISMNDNTLKLSDVYKDTNCTMSRSINDTFNNLDDTKNYVLMLKKDTIKSKMTVGEKNKVTINLNGQNLTSIGSDSTSAFGISGELSFNIKNVNLSDLGDKIVFDNHAGGIFNISNVQIDNTSPYTVYNAKQGIINIKNSTITNSSGSTIDNTDDGIINIVDCKFDAMLNVVDNNKLGTVNICSGSINGKTNDVINKGNGYVYYKDSNIFKNNSLNDTVNDPSHIILKSDLICEAK